jgi:hypothetical protein
MRFNLAAFAFILPAIAAQVEYLSVAARSETR